MDSPFMLIYFTSAGSGKIKQKKRFTILSRTCQVAVVIHNRHQKCPDFAGHL